MITEITIKLFIFIIILIVIKTIIDKELKKSKPKYNKQKGIMMSVTEISEYFGLTPREINNCFISLGWITKNGKWILATDLGKTQGAEEQYNTKTKQKYVTWEKDIVENEAFIKALNEPIVKKPQEQPQAQPKEQPQPKPQNKKTSHKEKIEKGALYEEYIALIYRANGYTIWEHGKDKGMKDMGIDLIVKKNKKIILIQCKNWNEEGKYKIDHKDIKVFRTEGRDFINRNEIFIGYELHLKYIISGDFMHPSAIHHINECNQENKNVSYEVIKIPSV